MATKLKNPDLTAAKLKSKQGHARGTQSAKKQQLAMLQQAMVDQMLMRRAQVVMEPGAHSPAPPANNGIFSGPPSPRKRRKK